MSRKPGSLKGLIVNKGEATSENRYIGDAPPAPAKSKSSGKASKPEPVQIDGRTLRRTGRTFKFAATVRPEWAADLKAIAADEGKLIVEVLEEMLEARKRKGKR